MSFVEKNGAKWAQIARGLNDRNDHNVKNRFFSLISKFLQIPIKIVKKKVDFLDIGLIRKTLMFLKSRKGKI